MILTDNRMDEIAKELLSLSKVEQYTSDARKIFCDAAEFIQESRATPPGLCLDKSGNEIPYDYCCGVHDCWEPVHRDDNYCRDCGAKIDWAGVPE